MGKKRSRYHPTTRPSSVKECFDLNVDFPTASLLSSGSRKTPEQILDNVLERVKLLGYSTIALSQTIYGRPNKEILKKGKQLIDVRDISEKYGIAILHRLNVVIEESSDVAYFNGSNGESIKFLSQFDLVSLVVRNASSFAAACSNANGVDMLVLDTSLGKLPFRIVKKDIQEATSRGLLFEFWYGPALVNPSKRKFLVQAVDNFLQVSASIRPKPRLVLSSGPRKLDNGEDIGGLAIRSVGDMENISRVVLRLGNDTAQAAMRFNAKVGIERGLDRICGDSGNVHVRVFAGNESASDYVHNGRTLHKLPKRYESANCSKDSLATTNVVTIGEKNLPSEKSDLDLPHSEDDEDGFITF